MSTFVYDMQDYAPQATQRKGAPTMTRTNLRTLAYFMIVGGVVVWVVGHLAPIRG